MRTPSRPTPPKDMSAAPKKSATDLIQELIDKQIQSKIEKVFNDFDKYLEPPTSNTITNTIGKKHTLFDQFYGSGYQGMYNTHIKTKIKTTPESDSRNVAPPLRIIDETKTLPV